MRLINFLNSSHIRNKLLELLWKDSICASIHQFSRLTSAPYSAAYKEIKNMERNGLVVSVKSKKSSLFQKNNHYNEAATLLKLLDYSAIKSKRVKIKLEDIYQNLAFYGAPIIVTTQPFVTLKIEDCLIKAIELSKKSPDISKVIPLVLIENNDRINFERLIYLAETTKLEHYLGFYLDISFKLSRQKQFRKAANTLLDKRYKNNIYFFTQLPTSKFEEELIDLNTPMIAKKWHFLMNMGLDSFQDLYKKHSR